MLTFGNNRKTPLRCSPNPPNLASEHHAAFLHLARTPAASHSHTTKSSRAFISVDSAAIDGPGTAERWQVHLRAICKKWGSEAFTGIGITPNDGNQLRWIRAASLASLGTFRLELRPNAPWVTKLLRDLATTLEIARYRQYKEDTRVRHQRSLGECDDGNLTGIKPLICDTIQPSQIVHARSIQAERRNRRHPNSEAGDMQNLVRIFITLPYLVRILFRDSQVSIPHDQPPVIISRTPLTELGRGGFSHGSTTTTAPREALSVVISRAL
ncbi:hypothetical protein DFH09DRAFT_1099439 [Mycena vulgaris]|nr:hypothetical protein DFH09DRAFT_1099439 [Mycena vulgaris]